MKKPRSSAVLAAAALIATPAAAFAQGAARVESSTIAVSVGAGARAFGMGGAFIAVADDATASSWNPAGLAVLEKPEASLVYKPLNRNTAVASPHTTESRQQFGAVSLLQTTRSDGGTFRQSGDTLEFVSVTYPFRSGSVTLVPQLSYQRVIDLNYTTSTVRRRNTNQDQVFTSGASRFQLVQDFRDESFDLDSHGGIDQYTASLGVGIRPQIFVGAAVNLWRNGAPGTSAYSSGVTYQSGANALCAAGSPCGRYAYSLDSRYEDAFDGVNFTVGALVKPWSRLRIGAVYKSGFDMTLESTETLTIFAPLLTNAAANQHTRTRTEVDATVSWPRTLGAGVSVLPTDRLTLSADFTTTQWSKAVAESSVLREDLVADSRTTSPTSGPWPGTYDPRAPVGPTNRPQRDTVQLRLGGEYLLGGRITVPVRAGVFRDRTIAPAPSGEDIYNTGVSLGTGIVWQRLAFDVAYVFLRSAYDTSFSSDAGHRDASTEDTTRIHRLYTSLIVRFDK